MANNLEKIAKANIQTLFPEAYCEGKFAKAIKGAYASAAYEEEWAKGGINVVPDCYFHFWTPRDDAEGGIDIFIVCEVEDTNPLTLNKLSHYGELWDRLYGNLEVWSFNRYGQFTTAHNLLWHFLQRGDGLNFDGEVMGHLKEENMKYLTSHLGMPEPRELSNIWMKMKEPLFPDNKKFHDRFVRREGDNPIFVAENWRPACEERRARVRKNYRQLIKQTRGEETHHAEYQ